MQDAFLDLLLNGTDTDYLEWYSQLYSYQDLMMVLLKLIADPGINAQLPEHHRKEAGSRLVELARLFRYLKDNNQEEAAMDLYYLEKYELPALRSIAATYESKTDSCCRDTVLVIG